MSIREVAALRLSMWTAGFRPVALLTGEKGTRAQAWPERALLNPPADAVATPTADYLNTGVFCAGLRVVDVDVDDPAQAATLRDLAASMLGETIERFRDDSPRRALVYRAAEGMPGKLTVVGAAKQAGEKCPKVEVLGRGQQLLAFGRHPDGADLQWSPCGPDVVCVSELPAITETQVSRFLEAAASVIGAAPTTGAVAPTGGATPGSGAAVSDRGATAEPLRVAAALAAIPNDGPADWEEWNKVGMATWAATAGNSFGLSVWDAWSARNESYNLKATRERWDHYHKSPPSKIGAGTLFHLSRDS